METKSFREEDTDTTEAGCASLYTEPARLNKYTILELARLPSITRKMMVEDWLESVYGKTTAAANVPSEGAAPISALEHGSDKLFKTSSTRDSSSNEQRILASRPPTTTEASAPCDANTTFSERKIYKWRKWATESV